MTPEQLKREQTLNEKVYDDAYAFAPEHNPFAGTIPASDVLDGTYINE